MSSLMSSSSRAVAVFAFLFLGLVTFGSAQQPKTQTPAAGFNRLNSYQPVTAERLKNPEDGNWLSIRRTYDGWGYSPLNQVTPENVKGLHPVWVFSTGEAKVHEA